MTNLSKLNSLINKLSDVSFEYGKNDCFTFTNALVKEWHGKGYRHLHPYKNKKQAFKYIKENMSFEMLITGTLGYPVAAEHCKDGDVVIAHIGGNDLPVLGFVYKGHGLFKTKTKVMKLSLKKCSRGWRIR